MAPREDQALTPAAEATVVDGKERTRADSVESRPDEVAPTMIGRYWVEEELGRGGMGVVYRAHDPKLGRAVAIKLVRESRSTSSDARDRLGREARTLARLSHPNVVEVFEIGVHEGQLFIAMELVVGDDLRDWSASSEREVAQVVEVMVQAGRGLAAAHSAGLVHRDFKPDNVIVATDGRVRVLDFGLARAPSSLSSRSIGGARVVSGDDKLTQTGLAMGTPAYMAPEQFRARGDDARMDQFGFCVTLFELLAGERPYLGTSFHALARATATEAIVDERAARVDSRVLRVLRRGLRADPDARYPDMEALLTDLVAAVQVRRRRWLAALGVLALGGVVVASAREPDACSDTAVSRARIWGEAQQTQLQSAIEGTGLQYAPAVWKEVDAHAEAYATQWAIARGEACRAARDGALGGEVLLDCLERRQRLVSKSLEVLASAKGPSIHNAPKIVAGFAHNDRCSEGGSGPMHRDTLVDEELREALVGATTSLDLGLYAAGVVAIEALLGRLSNETPREFIARAQLTRGRLLLGAGQALQAANAFEAAYFAGSDASRFDLATRAAARIAESGAVGYERRWTWARHSAAALARNGPDSQLTARHDASMCALQRDSGDLEDAIRRCESVLQQYEGTNPEAEIDALRKLAAVVIAGSDPKRAYALRKRAVALAEATWGQEHPVVADSVGDLGMAALVLARHEEAQRLGRRALAIREQTLGAEHPDVAMAMDLLAAVAQSQGEFERAWELAENGRALRVAAFGETHPLIARSLYARALAEEKLQRYEDALETMNRVAAIDELLHPLNIDRIPTLREQARMAFEFGDGALRGRTHLERAWEIVEESKVPRDHPLVRDLNHGYGETLLELGEAEAALPYLEAYVGSPGTDRVMPHVKFVLARCLVAAGREPERARRIVREAIASWDASTVAFHLKQTDAMRAWLKEHR